MRRLLPGVGRRPASFYYWVDRAKTEYRKTERQAPPLPFAFPRAGFAIDVIVFCRRAIHSRSCARGNAAEKARRETGESGRERRRAQEKPKCRRAVRHAQGGHEPQAKA